MQLVVAISTIDGKTVETDSIDIDIAINDETHFSRVFIGDECQAFQLRHTVSADSQQVEKIKLHFLKHKCEPPKSRQCTLVSYVINFKSTN